MIGRFAIVEYCKTLFTATERENIEKGTYQEGTDEEIYYNNYIADNKISFDRVIFQKRCTQTPEGSYQIEYVPICNLHQLTVASSPLNWKDYLT